MKRLETKWNNASLQLKLTISFSFTLVIILAMNIYMYMNINKMMGQVDEVYASNVNLNELSDALEQVQDAVKGYLVTKSSDALDTYYRAEQDYRRLLNNLNQEISGNYMEIMEKNIHAQSETYLEQVYDTVQAKRGRNVEKYKASYEEATRTYTDVKNCIFSLNNQKFKNNTDNYLILLSSLRYM